MVDDTGNWSYPNSDEVIAAERQRRILEAWPIHKQMEAMTDSAAGDHTKLNELKLFLKKVKEDLPYVNRPPKYE